MRVLLVLVMLSGCAEDNDSEADGSAGAGGAGGEAGAGGAGGAGGGRVPLLHRAQAEACDDERSAEPPNPDPNFAECMTHEECTEGENGRCVGNGHDGWYCTYDECFADDTCENVCACEGGFRSDHNICIGGNCRVDADCGSGGFCSPSLGGCGHYNKFEGYWCHTPEDTCVDDADCETAERPWAYCAWSPDLGHWACSDSECVGKQ